MKKNPPSTSCLLIIITAASIILTNSIACAYPYSTLWTLINEAPNSMMSNDRLNGLLARVGPDMRAAHDYHDFQDIYLNDSMLAMRILHEQAKVFADDQAKLQGPKLERLLRDAKVNKSCLNSIQMFTNSIKDLDFWSVKMWDSSGNFPPNGFLDGQLTDMGSYQGCINLKAPISKVGGLEYATYCVVAFRPLVPTRRKNHMIFQTLDADLFKLFNESDAFSQILNKAQFFQYMYLKTGVCVPSNCGARDLQQVANLIARRLAITAGPVKCFSRSTIQPAEETLASTVDIENNPVQVHLNKALNEKQLVSLYILLCYFALVFLATLWHSLELIVGQIKRHLKNNRAQEDKDFSLKQLNSKETQDTQRPKENIKQQIVTVSQLEAGPTGLKSVAFQYLSVITNTVIYCDTSTRPTEITCLHGLRVLTMIWIICVHTLQYNEWSIFSRTFHSATILQNPFVHPIFNANYVVDNFFFISGLLAGYSTWLASQRGMFKFNLSSSIVGRYLRLTPQVLLVSLLYILLPLAGDGPFWYDVTHHAAKDCERNWWVNLLHIQSLYNKRQICNLVGWWISTDMIYYILSLALILMVLENKIKLAVWSSISLVGSLTIGSAYLHYSDGLNPNNLGAAPQVADVWINYVGRYFASPLTHSFPFFLGFWVGHWLVLGKGRQLVQKWSRTGWILSSSLMLIIDYSSYIWTSGAVEIGSQYISTAYNLICPIVWILAFAWLIVSCHYGHLPRLNLFLSSSPFILVSKASFIIYLTHMLVVMSFYGSHNLVIEVSLFSLTYTIIGNNVISIVLGVFLFITFEIPCLKFQRLVVVAMRANSRRQATISNKSPKQFTLHEDQNSAPKIEISSETPLK